MGEITSKLRLRIVLREYLEAHGITVSVLAKWVQGISPKTVYAIANGTRRPSLEALEAILQGLRVHGVSAVLSDIVKAETIEDDANHRR